MSTIYNMLSRDAQIALTEFSSEFDAALAVADPATLWSSMFGLVNSSKAIKTTYPIPVSAAGYQRRKGDDKMRRLYERSLSMKPVQWVDGVEEQAMIVEAPDFIGWAGEPARIAREGVRQPNILVADMLHANPLLDFYRNEHSGGSTASTLHLFEAANHQVNVLDTSFGVFGNTSTASAIDATMLKAVKTKFRQRKGPNGKVMGLRVTHLLVPAAREEEAKDFLESDNLVIAVENVGKTENVAAIPTNNRHKGTVVLVVGDELEDDDIIYAIDASKGCYPWIVQTSGSPEEIVYDKNSDHYKDTNMIGVKFVLTMAAAAALPHAIEQITLS